MSKEQETKSKEHQKKHSVDEIKAIKDAKNKAMLSTEPIKKC